MAKEVVGQWSAAIELSNVPVHVSLLPTGKVLYFGRRADPKGVINDASLNEHFTKAFVWDPATNTSIPTANEPRGTDNTPVNLFCAGHCLLPDGNVFIVGGHREDGLGIRQACVYNPSTNTFTAKPAMNGGRWYPSALTLPDGRVMVMSGSLENEPRYNPNQISQIWSSDTSRPNPWTEVVNSFNRGPGALPLYPRLHLTPKGRIFMAGPQQRSWYLDLKDANGADIKTQVAGGEVAGAWSDAGVERQARFRDYAPSVMYDAGKVMYIGGGETDGQGPTNEVEFINLNDASPKWTSSPSTNMKNPRRQFNATILPDGTVLVTGGTRGAGFNDLSNPVRQAELFDPAANKWIDMASESFNRCYHSVALLLPDGRVMSGGGGEYGGITKDDCLTNAQFFEPPYLYKPGQRPVIVNAPSEISYGKEFAVTLQSGDAIGKVSWVRLGSVTHCRNMNQSLIFLQRNQNGPTLTVTAPANANLAPPGHYLLFVLSNTGKPSVGKVVRISAPPPAVRLPRVAAVAVASTSSRSLQPSLAQYNDAIMAEQGRPPVVVGITPVCPYGLGPCWGGAYDGLNRMSDISVVCPVAHQEDSVAHVYLEQDNLPDLNKWRKEFAKTVNTSYEMRGIELTLSGVVSLKQDKLTLAGTSTRQELVLAPFTEASQIKWDVVAKAARPVSEGEAAAYERLADALAKHAAEAKVEVTGTLQKGEAGSFSLDVRDFKVLDAAS
ncbi:hypothetical protein OQA88_10942 [Cercophora sp. LCS_1]